MPAPRKRRQYRPTRNSRNRRHLTHSSPQASALEQPEVKPEIASIILRTRTASTRAEFQQLCQEAIDLHLNDPDTLQAYYQKKINALPPGS